MLNKHVALALGLWTLQVSVFAAEPLPTTTPANTPPLALVAIQGKSESIQTDLPTKAMDLELTIPIQLQLPEDNAYSRPRREDWLESNHPGPRTAWSFSSGQSSNHLDSPEDAGLEKARQLKSPPTASWRALRVSIRRNYSPWSICARCSLSL